MKSLIILGEYKDSFLNRNINRLARCARAESMSVCRTSYEELLGDGRVKADHDDVSVMFFFPYTFWDNNCEIPEDTGVYGTSRESYETFKNFWADVKGKLGERFRDHNLSFVIDPDYAAVDRDKIETHRLLRLNGVSTTTTVPNDLKEILGRLNGKGIFIKPRYGAKGKGITYLSKGEWITNYRVGENGKIENYGDRERWKFDDITGNEDFVKRLLDLEMIVEEEVQPPRLNGDFKFDVRVYSVFGDAPHMFVRENDGISVLTNNSQGGTINHDYREVLPEEAIASAMEESLKASKVLNSNFLGVDCIFDRTLDKPVVLEVQTFTGFPLVRKVNILRFLARKISDFP